MEVNVKKSEVVVVNSNFLDDNIQHKWQFQGKDLPNKDEFVYLLGILFKKDHGMVGKVELMEPAIVSTLRR